MKKLKALLKAADAAIETMGSLKDKFMAENGDGKQSLIANLKALKSPETIEALKKSLEGKSPAEIKKVLAGTHKSLSGSDMLELAQLLTEEDSSKKVQAFIDRKINEAAAKPVVKKPSKKITRKKKGK